MCHQLQHKFYFFLSPLIKKTMDKKQALGILKQILDAASKSGLFENMEASMAAAQAYNVIATEINKIDGLHAITD
jgi:hypothetical protein